MKRVLVVDDSVLMRQMLSDILSSTPELEVVGAAADPFEARSMIKKLNPDVITLDIEMPHMDGITFLRNLMRLRPTPVVMVSSFTKKGAEATLLALELGAVDFLAKPMATSSSGLADYAQELIDKVVLAAGVRVYSLEQMSKPDKAGNAPGATSIDHRFTDNSEGQIIGIGASTGGTEAIKAVLRELSPNMPGILVCQHIPKAFSSAFAARVDGQTRLAVSEARHGEQILPGHVYIAPGDRHLMVERKANRYFCQLDNGPLVNQHKPSVDVLFHSLAVNVGPDGICVMLTGMGCDGAAGMGELRQAGGYNLVQDEKSSVVWGMPGEAVRRGFADEVLDLGQIPQRLMQLAQR